MPVPSKPLSTKTALSRLFREYNSYIEEERAFSEKLRTLQTEPSPDHYEIQRTQEVLSDLIHVRTNVGKLMCSLATEVSNLGGLKPEEEKLTRKAIDIVARHE